MTTEKTTAEILASWEADGICVDWYAIDSYDPMTGATTRLYVGERSRAMQLMADYYTRPCDTALGNYYRCSLVSAEDARTYFESIDATRDARAYTVTEAAKALGISRQRVHKKLQDGKLRGLMVDTTWTVFLSDDDLKRD